MAFDLSGIGTYTTAEKISAVDHAIMSILLGGQGYSMNGRQLTRVDLDSLREYRAELVAEASDATAEGSSGLALVQFGERV